MGGDCRCSDRAGQEANPVSSTKMKNSLLFRAFILVCFAWPISSEAAEKPNAVCVLGIFRHLSNAFKQVWAKGRPKRQGTSVDWVEENLSKPWRGIRLITQSVPFEK